MILQNFIVFEGIDGAGTTTQIDALKKRADGTNMLFTAEPTSAETGKFLRKMLRGEIPISNETAAYAFAADRNEHINGNLLIEGNSLVTGVREACANGNLVISDRYFFSSLAYQSVGIRAEIPRTLNSFFPLPELLFFFSLDPETALRRIDGRETKEIYERSEFLKSVSAEYRNVLSEYDGTPLGSGMKTVYIDATLPKEQIGQQIWEELNSAGKIRSCPSPHLPIYKK